jgi:hypothetical protein
MQFYNVTYTTKLYSWLIFERPINVHICGLISVYSCRSTVLECTVTYF